MIKKFNGFIIFCSISFCLVCCKSENSGDCFKTTGSIIEERREISEITEIEVYDNITLYIEKDSVSSLRVEAGENLLELIETSVIGNRLIIRNNNVCNWVRSYKIPVLVYLKTPKLNYIKFESSKDVHILNGFKTDSLYLESEYGGGTIYADLNSKGFWFVVHANCADIKASGNTDYLYIWNVGVGEQHFENLKTNAIYIEQRGNGDCYLNAGKYLRSEIHYNGNVYFSGNPVEIINNEYAKGKLIKQ